MQNIDNFRKTDHLKPNYHQSKSIMYQQNAQPYYNNYQQQRSDFVAVNQFAHHGFPSNDKFTRQYNYQPSVQQQPNLYGQNQYLQQAPYQQQQPGNQDYYNHQSFNYNLIENSTDLFLILPNT